MGRRRRGGQQGGGSSAMDIMTALIGCLILILLGILIIVLVSQVLVVIANPDDKQVESVVESQVDGFRETKAFPFGNRIKEPIYVDTYPDKIILYPKDITVKQRELMRPGNDFDIILQIAATRPDDEYLLFLIRPQANGMYERLRRKVDDFNRRMQASQQFKTGQSIEMGMELYESDRRIGDIGASRARLKEYDIEEFRRKRRQSQLSGEDADLSATTEGAVVEEAAPTAPEPAETP